MTPDKAKETWKEICFILSKSVSEKTNEKDFESQVVRAIEALGWKEFRDEIKRQTVLKIGHGGKLQPDLVVYDNPDDPLIAIEVKRPAEDLSKDDVSSQLQSYMRQLKAEYGLAIGKTIRFFYDGDLYKQKEPVLLGEFEFNENSEEGRKFVQNIDKESLASQSHIEYLTNLINKVKDKRTISKLRKILLNDQTKEKILNYLKNEFTVYGSEIVEGALKTLDIQINRKEALPPPSPSLTGGQKRGLSSTTVKGKIMELIQASQAGVSRKEICKKLKISGKQASNAIYRLTRGGYIKSDGRGIYAAAYGAPIKKRKIKPSKLAPKNINIREEVFKAIAKYKNGASTENIVKKTGLKTKQIRNALHALKKTGKITSIERGLFKAL
jgi:Fe2+ or Zn2+ uptake regulation protein